MSNGAEDPVVFDNGVAIYTDEGDTILQRYSEQYANGAARPEWNQLAPDVRMGLMAAAAESPRWRRTGDLDPYRIAEFEAEHGDIFNRDAADR